MIDTNVQITRWIYYFDTLAAAGPAARYSSNEYSSIFLSTRSEFKYASYFRTFKLDRIKIEWNRNLHRVNNQPMILTISRLIPPRITDLFLLVLEVALRKNCRIHPRSQRHVSTSESYFSARVYIASILEYTIESIVSVYGTRVNGQFFYTQLVSLLRV